MCSPGREPRPWENKKEDSEGSWAEKGGLGPRFILLRGEAYYQ